MHRGYIKLWRRVFDSGIQKEHMTFSMWIWILGNVTHKTLKYISRGQQITINPGEMLVGRKKLAAELGISEQNVRTCLHHLELWGNLTITSTNRFSILKVNNWETYQETEKQTNQQINQEVTSNQPAANHKTIIKEHKNIKKERGTLPPELDQKEKKQRRQIPPDFQLTDDLKTYAKQQGLNGDVLQVFEHFKDHHRAKGTVMLDWPAAWRTWVRNEIKFSKSRQTQPQQPAGSYTPPDRLERILRENQEREKYLRGERN